MIPEWAKDKLADICDDLTDTVWALSEMGIDESEDLTESLVHYELDKASEAASLAYELVEILEGEETMSRVRVPIKLSDGAQMPSYAYDRDAGLDLRSAQNLIIWPGKRELIKTGIAVAIPEGYAGFIQPRSGLAINKGLTVLNTPGLIDSQYRGEIKVALINHGDERVAIQEGDRIAQLVIQQVPKVELVRVAELSETARGEGGFGSSGVA